LLARREHSRHELSTKLWAHARKIGAADPDGSGEDTDWQRAIDTLLDELEAQRYLSDARFAESRVHTRAAGQGQARIRQELARHGVELPDDLAQTLRSTELDRARALWQRRFGTPAQDVREQARQMRFLAARGFSGDVIRRVLHDPAGDEDPGKP
jgi:regulatory protein